jgi:RNA polymerase-binding transcription factor DksA
MRKTNRAKLKERLLVERERTLASLNRKRCHDLTDFEDDTTRDAGDLASTSHDKDLLYRLQDSDAARLRAIDEMLSRLEENGYTCERCGGPISEARAEALPWATHCRPCQEAIDTDTVAGAVTAEPPRHHSA